VRNLETVLALALMPEYPPFISSEIADIVKRARAEEPLTRVELHRIEKQSPIVEEIERCRAEVVAIEAELLAGNPDVEGLCLALADWSAELRIPPAWCRWAACDLTRGWSC
jgi:hypothetical protein